MLRGGMPSSSPCQWEGVVREAIGRGQFANHDSLPRTIALPPRTGEKRCHPAICSSCSVK